MHNAAFDAANLPHGYFAMDVQPRELGVFLVMFRRAGGLGANLTLPLKESVLEHVEERTAPVNSLGAANTLFWLDEDTLALDNTDVHGFRKLIEPWMDRVRNQPVCVLGAGGAARACVYALKGEGCPRVVLWNRTHERALDLRDQFADTPMEVLTDRQLERGDFSVGMVVNATSLGLEPGDPSPFPTSRIQSDMVGVDLIYGHETQFMHDFENRGQDSVGGLMMLIHQAAAAWEHWVGRQPDIQTMEQAARGEMEGSN